MNAADLTEELHRLVDSASLALTNHADALLVQVFSCKVALIALMA
jgi:hypothetical protein